METSIKKIYESFVYLNQIPPSTTLQTKERENKTRAIASTFVGKELSVVLKVKDVNEEFIVSGFEVYNGQLYNAREGLVNILAVKFDFELFFEKNIREELMKLSQKNSIKIKGKISRLTASPSYVYGYRKFNEYGDNEDLTYEYFPSIEIAVQLNSCEQSSPFAFTYDYLTLTQEEIDRAKKASEIKLKKDHEEWKVREFQGKMLIICVYIAAAFGGFYITEASSVAGFLLFIVAIVVFLYQKLENDFIMKFYENRISMAALGLFSGILFHEFFY